MQYKVYSGTNLVDVIGSGRNLYQDAHDFANGALWYNYTSSTKVDGNYNGYTIMQANTMWNGLGQLVWVKAGETYTFSAFARYASGTGTSSIYWLPPNNDGKTTVASVTLASLDMNLTSDWQRISSTTTVTQDGYILARVERGDTNDNMLQVAGLKLERGGVATLWSPAPEDLGLDPTQNNLHGYQLTGLTPATSYTMSVVANNGLMDSSKASVTFTTADTVVIPRALTVGSTVSLSYVEYALGLVPIGNEPSGDFGGTKAKILTGKVASVSGSNSTIEFSGVTFAAGKAMTLNAGGVYMAVDGYKSIYYKP